MKVSIVGGAAIVVAIALATVGCTPTSELAPPAPIKTTEQATPPETPEPEPIPEKPNCENIVYEDTIVLLQSEGFTMIDDHESELRAEDRIEARFFDYGGVDCLWGIAAGGDSMATFGYSEISDAAAAEAQAWLGENGYVRSEEGTDVIYEIDSAHDVLGHGDVFLFEPGAWYHSNFREPINEIREAVAQINA